MHNQVTKTVFIETQKLTNPSVFDFFPRITRPKSQRSARGCRSPWPNGVTSADWFARSPKNCVGSECTRVLPHYRALKSRGFRLQASVWKLTAPFCVKKHPFTCPPKNLQRSDHIRIDAADGREIQNYFALAAIDLGNGFLNHTVDHSFAVTFSGGLALLRPR